jgi:hypothetical protein
VSTEQHFTTTAVIMHSTTIIVALAAAIATATPVQQVRQETSPPPAINPFPITLTQLYYPHGHQIVAITPTRTTLGDSCNTNVNATRTAVVQAQDSGFPSNPLCNHPFALEGVSDLTLTCADSAQKGENASQVIGIATNGEQTHQCVSIPRNVYPMSCGVGTSISQLWACQ